MQHRIAVDVWAGWSKWILRKSRMIVESDQSRKKCEPIVQAATIRARRRGDSGSCVWNVLESV